MGAFLGVLGVGIGCSNNTYNGHGGSGGSPNVANRTYNQLENCSETQGNQAPICAFSDGATKLYFTDAGGGNWKAVNVPDSGFTEMGTFLGSTYMYTGTAAGYVEHGTLTFDANGNSYTGSSTYVANDNSFTGSCHFNGAIVPNDPPNADPIGPCP